MIYTKPIEEITFADVLRFCEEAPRENIHLDFKQEIGNSLAKTIAAMANTWGGIVLIGVSEDDDSKPVLPIAGIGYDDHLRERVNNIVLGNITPAVFPEVQVYPLDDDSRAVIIVRVSQSNLTPHAIRGGTRVYLRTDTSNEPEELATVERVAWLAERRNRSASLRRSFYETAERRFASLCTREGAEIEHADATFASSPLYPFTPLVDYRELREGIPAAIRVRAHHGLEFPRLLRRVEFVSAQGGVYGFLFNEELRYICYEEFNEHGFFYHREDMAEADTNARGEVRQRAYLDALMKSVDVYVEVVQKLYEELGYWGHAELRIQLRRLSAVGFIDLPAPRGRTKFETIVRVPVDDCLEFVKEVSCATLREERCDLVLKQARWETA